MEDIIGILLYNTFIELPVSLKKVGKARTLLTLLGTPSREKKHATYCVASRDLGKFEGNQK